MPKTTWTCPVCYTQSDDDYNVTVACWAEAGFTSQPCLTTAQRTHADEANWWRGEFTYYRNTHIDCLEARLGRRFTVDDFPDAPCNIGIRETIASGGLVRLPQTLIGCKLRHRMITLEMLCRRYLKNA